jgi:hypothetical protein
MPLRGPKLYISIFILLMIGLHALPVILRQGERQTLWPFLAWAMYKDSRPPGPIQAEERHLFGVTAKGMKEEVTWPVAGLSVHALGRTYIRPMLTADSSAARELLTRLNVGRADPFVEILLEIERYTISDTGLVREHLPVTAYRFGSPQPAR